MKKLFAALLVSGLTLSGFSATNVEAASGNSIQSVEQLEQGDQELGKKGKGKILRASMVYNEPNGPSFNEVKKEVSNKASAREHYNDVTGNIGYIQDDNLSYQFTTTSPDDKDIKLYRIDLS